MCVSLIVTLTVKIAGTFVVCGPAPSPAGAAAQLSAPSGNNWLAYYAALSGSRSSTLNQITTSNVASLKEVWHMNLGPCTAAPIAGEPVIPGAPRGAANNPTNC